MRRIFGLVYNFYSAYLALYFAASVMMVYSYISDRHVDVLLFSAANIYIIGLFLFPLHLLVRLGRNRTSK